MPIALRHRDALARAAAALALAVATFALLGAGRARACGTSGPEGVSACSLAGHREEERPKWRWSLSGVTTWTALNFSGGLRADETRTATLLSVAYSPTPRWTFEAGAGAAFGGKLSLPDGAHTFSPGPSTMLGASWKIVEGRPFVIASAQLSFTSARTHSDSAAATAAYDAFDLRLSGIVGVTLWDRLSPYALVRVFGGPIEWTYAGAQVTGTDVNHYQVGAGLALLLTRRCDLFVEGAPLGEQALAGGVSLSY